jgi:glycosyltransferase involved in cell wall biosynthesis
LSAFDEASNEQPNEQPNEPSKIIRAFTQLLNPSPQFRTIDRHNQDQPFPSPSKIAMKILEVLTYYRPHVSGLTIYVERLCEALAAQGHEVTVLTSQFDNSLPLEETVRGVKIIRVPVAFRISKGVIMPTFGIKATRWARWADVMHLHLPQFDAPGLALRGKLLGRPVILTYHCDLQLPTGGINKAVNAVVKTMNQIAGSLSNAVVTYTRDYGMNTPFLKQYLEKKLHIIPPPVALAECSAEHSAAFRRKHHLQGRKVVGISARLATEKGVEVLLNALPLILREHPDAVILHAGPYQNVLGEEAYAARLEPFFTMFQKNYLRLGTLHGADLTAFYKNLDCLVICSLNSTESFGLVQIEAMKNGVPVVASNLPGVRQSVTMTGMGEVVPIGDYDALGQSINQVLSNKKSYQRDATLIGDTFSPDQTAAEYLKLFKALIAGVKGSTTPEPGPYEKLRQMRDNWNKA